MNMIKKLRRKFILVATAVVIIIVVGALSLINFIAYMRMNSQIQSFLTYISQNDGNIYQKKIMPNSDWFGETTWSEDTPDFPYQIRFFSVLVDSNGYVKEINIKNTVAFTEKEAVQYAQTSVQSGKLQGYFKKNRANYAYMITQNGDGNILIVIMDCTREMVTISDFMQDSLSFGCICILLFVLILSVLSNMAIKPFVHNIESQKRFITNAGHELKTPLAIISANTEAMELINGKNQWTQSILKQIKRSSKLINDLIMLSKMSEGSKIKMNFALLNLSEIVQEIDKSFSQMTVEQQKQLTSQIELNVYIQSDAKYLYELVNILVDNAVKYCDDNGTIAISLATKKKDIILSVANDYAEGKNVDYSRFFERFYRGDVSHSSEKAGYGIGLSIAEELTQLLNGKIKVEYTAGKFMFSLKFKLASPPKS